MLACLRLASRRLHCYCLRLNAARDPAYLGLFEPKQQDCPSPEEQEARTNLRIAFCYKIRDWARTTPPEYISRPPSRSRSHKKKESATRKKKNVPKEELDQHDVDDEEGEESDDFEEEEADDGELYVVDDEDELKALDNEQEDSIDKEDSAAQQDCNSADGFHVGDADGERTAATGETRDTTSKETAGKNVLILDPPNVGPEADEQLYYFTESGKLKYKPILILAPKDEIYQRLHQSGLVSSKRKRPMPVSKLVKKSDAEIVGWFYYCSIELLQFFRVCHNLKEVKAIVEYHIRWSAIRTLAKKYKCNPREIVKKYGRDLECEDKKGKKVRLMTRQEIKEVSRGVNKRVEMYHRFLALNILDEMD
ncbi:hypothetical protein L7F22_049205 [Adiantum nelumboides]|nr:hypothetical protein [Adiantum nelumboides]